MKLVFRPGGRYGLCPGRKKVNKNVNKQLIQICKQNIKTNLAELETKLDIE